MSRKRGFQALRLHRTPSYIPHILALGTICSLHIPLGRQTSPGKQRQNPKHTQHAARFHTAEGSVGKSRQ